MTDRPETPPTHRRRPRYPGTHPRRFADKYKELTPEKYPEAVAHVRARGKTPAGQHVPILVDAVLDVLAPRPGELAVDATLGWGGHAERVLERLMPGGTLLGLDADPIELPKTDARLRARGYNEDTLRIRRTNFASLHSAIGEAGWHEGADIIFADLGLSSMQIDDPARGFSFKHDGPLDMRMNPKRGLSAAEWLARTSPDLLARAFADSDERDADAQRIAETIALRQGQLRTTPDLVRTVRDALHGAVPEADVEMSVRRVFQAVRIAVNDEFAVLDALLRQVPACLRAGGRVAILTFHSGEDRRVKRAFADGLRDGTYREVARDVIRASPAERRANPRAGSAKLRWARRAGALSVLPDRR